jgi:hypothetical protein
MLNLNFVKQKPSNRSLVKHITKKIESLLSPEIGDIQILVTEVQCFEPDCVPIETLIILLGSENSRWTTKILKPITEVTDDDIRGLDIPSTLPIPRSKEKISPPTSPPPSPPAWVGSLLKMIDEQQGGPRYRDGLEYLHKYLTKKLEPTEKSIHAPTPPTPLPQAPTMVRMKATTPSPSPSSSSMTSSPQPSSAPSPTLAKMKPESYSEPRPPPVSVQQSVSMSLPNQQPLILQPKQIHDEEPKPRHKKGVRQRGCPCCDPDNLDNIVDRLLYFDAPP